MGTTLMPGARIISETINGAELEGSFCISNGSDFYFDGLYWIWKYISQDIRVYS